MNILIVTQYYWPESFIVNGLAQELQKRGHQVTVFTGLPNYPTGLFFKDYSFMKGPWSELIQGVNVIRVPLFPRGKGFLRLALNYLSFVFFGVLFGFFKKMPKPDVIFCYAPSPVTSCLPAIALKWRFQKKLIFWVQDLWPESMRAVGATSSTALLKFIGLIVNFIYQQCDLILTQSEAFFPSILKRGVSSEKLRYMPNWADPFILTSQVPTWVNNLPPGFKVAFAGNIGKAQDIPTLLAAAEILKSEPEIKWIIAGDGSEKAWLEAEVVRRNLTKIVFVVGKRDYNDMFAFFNAVDVLYVSLANQSIFSLTVPAKVQAYMSAGRPIVASLAGEGARVISKANCGFSCEPESPENLALAILKMKRMSPEQRKTFGDNGLEYFKKNFEQKICIDKIEIILLENITTSN